VPAWRSLAQPWLSSGGGGQASQTLSNHAGMARLIWPPSIEAMDIYRRGATRHRSKELLGGFLLKAGAALGKRLLL